MATLPLAYFLSWTCYGQWLHGDERGAVDGLHNIFGEPWLSPDDERLRANRERLLGEPYQLDAPRRRLVREAIQEVCSHRGWTLHALHVRALHVHAVVTGEAAPERMLNDFKAYASRRLNAAALDDRDVKRWTRHGSTRYVWKELHLLAVIEYVLEKQGEPMERYPESTPSEPRPLGSGGTSTTAL